MKAEWQKYYLDDIAISIQPGPFGTQLHSSDYSDSGTPVVMPTNMQNGKINPTKLVFVNDEHVQRLSRHQVKEGDILFARKGDVKKAVYITKKEAGWLTGSDCLKVELNKDLCYPKFIFYFMQSPLSGRWLEKNSIGATMPSVNSKILGDIEIRLPKKEIQIKISEILSAYDDLIENNNKQIKLLEEAAQKLYKEWFVKLNFPGHENVKIVDGLPEGWHIGNVGEIGNFKRGKVITKAQTVKGNIPVIAGGIEPAYYHNVANTLCPVITVSASGNAGFVKMYYCEVWASDCSYLDSNSTDNLFFVYTVLKSKQEYLYSLQKGACQKHVNATEINNLEILIPTTDLISKFNELSKTYFENIRVLQAQNKDLISSRDKLLPKLMNQEIAVTA